ncbi:hypothetical protein LRAMOSA11402 [Lichtheimia ramosa]|uniref:Cytochrome P450 n=1 Tax=Lichtheimia ramosa TaxID=688394 RepID=A0A077WTJ2_9FUNG|nr:hypothetical protein LRAMOSA11402 [Lichtheimia ramosa]
MGCRSIDQVSKELTIPAGNKSESGFVLTKMDGQCMLLAQKLQRSFYLKQASQYYFYDYEYRLINLSPLDIFPKADRSHTHGTLFGRMLGTRHIGSLTGAQWKAHRKIANPAFHGTMPVKMFGQLGSKLFGVMDELCKEGPIDIHDLTERWTLDALGKAAFDFDFNAVGDKNSEWVVRYNAVMSATFEPLYLMLPKLDTWFLPLNAGRKQKHAECDSLLSMIDDIIATKRQTLKNQKQEEAIDQEDDEKDVLTMMIEAEKSGQGIMSNEELRNNMVIFFIAGHDTTSNALANIAYEFAVNPDVQAKAREEAIRVLGDAPEDVIPTAEQWSQMPYIHQAIKENLRVHPPAASTLARTTTQDTELAGTFIPKGSKVVLDIYELHHNPKVWSDPDTFKPERFAPGGEAEQLAGQGMPWLPFINGRRQCLGMNFSLAEQRTLLPMLLRKYELSLPEDSIHKNGLHTKGLVLGLKPLDLQIVFKPRY